MKELRLEVECRVPIACEIGAGESIGIQCRVLVRYACVGILALTTPPRR